MDPLNLNLADVDTTPDRLNNKHECLMTVESASVEESKAKPGNHNLKVVFVTVNPEPSQKGTIISPGYKLSNYLPLQQSDNEKAPDFKVGLARLIDAVFNNPEPRPQLSMELLQQMVGRQVLVTVKLEDNEQYGPSNSVARVKAVE